MRPYLHALISLLLVFSFANMAAAQDDSGFQNVGVGERFDTDGDTFNTGSLSVDDVNNFNSNMDTNFAPPPGNADPVAAAVKAAKANPTNAATIAAEAAAANPDQAVAIALAVAKAFPGQRAKIATAVAKAVPAFDEEIVEAIANEARDTASDFEAGEAEVWQIWFQSLGRQPPDGGNSVVGQGSS